jgi:hypothetical protein
MKILDTISDPKKAATLGIILIVTILIIWIISKLFSSKIAELKAKSQAKKMLEEEISAGGGLFYSESEYTQFANKLYRAMNGIGTDEKSIYEVFEAMRSKADVLKLIQVFGVRDSETLEEWMAGDLSSGEIRKINLILSKNGINYTF